MFVRKLFLLAGLLQAVAASRAAAAAVQVVVPAETVARVDYGAEQLVAALQAVGLEATLRRGPAPASERDATTILVGRADSPALRGRRERGELKLKAGEPGKEGFVLATLAGREIAVAGGDDSGALYGCLELARRVREAGRLPTELRFADRPGFVLRGPCIGMQKTAILPGRHVYEYPYTSELFPFFYDRELWREYLDLLVANRMNTLYLWNGHPFASLVRLPDYPEALEVSEEQFAKNVAMFRYLTSECDRRGIWLVQMFYNIILSQPFAEKHHLATQLRAPDPVAADYMRKSIAEFVKQYPNVGLMPCLGEALQGTANQIAWTTDVILPGVHDGMAAAGLTTEPPVVFRTHAMDPEAIMPAAFKAYSNLFTETKFNGESLTTWEPRGKDQATHLAMSRLGPHLVNIHVLSNLEPFRYGAPRFIQKSVQAARDRLGATGLHLYPLSYWNWPDAPDKTAVPLKQWDRDWIWFEAWARYAWNPDIDAATDRAYWIGRIAERYGSAQAAAGILDAYNADGEVAPRIIRRFGITEGNRQTMALGMTLDQLVNPEKYGVLPDLWESQSPPGERLQDFVEKELAQQPHEGETPPQIVREIDEFSAQAVAALDAAAPAVTKNREEFARLGNDAACIRAMALSYGAKAGAARHVLRFKKTGEVAEMEQAKVDLAESLAQYRTLERLTRDSYAYANSMQTSQRRIPVVGGGAGGKPANFHWTQLLPLYEKEFADFDAQVTALKSGGASAARAQTLATLRAAPFAVVGRAAEAYTIKAGARVFTDAADAIASTASELDGLKGIRASRAAAQAGRDAPVEISTAGPVRVLIGYVRADSPEWRQPPRSETDARAAERGGTEPLLLAAVAIPSLPPVDVYELTFDAGRHKIDPPGSGAFLILGIVQAGPAP
jgi:hypothetical protein